MKKTLMTLLMLGVGATSLAAMSNDASAGGRHGWHGHFKWNYAPYGFHHNRHHWKNKCHFYFKKAKHTGKRHWWKKYQWCVDKHRYHGG